MRRKKGGKGDKGGKKGEIGGEGGTDSERRDGAEKDRKQDGGSREPGDLPHEGMVIHCAVMEEVSSTFANDGWAHFDGVVVDNPRPASTASMTDHSGSLEKSTQCFPKSSSPPASPPPLE